LFTTLRELIENSLDAAESCGVLPEIIVNMFFALIINLELFPLDLLNRTELTERQMNKQAIGYEQVSLSQEMVEENEIEVEESKSKKKKKPKKKEALKKYYKITICDNGCGIAKDNIPELMGRVLSGSKYGLRQTRGKFGLGSKMALIWAKKSTGGKMRLKKITKDISFKQYYGRASH